jgi:hypothetical protein
VRAAAERGQHPLPPPLRHADRDHRRQLEAVAVNRRLRVVAARQDRRPAHPGAYLATLPVTTTLRYYLLGNSGIVDDGTYGYMASYNSPPPASPSRRSTSRTTSGAPATTARHGRSSTSRRRTSTSTARSPSPDRSTNSSATTPAAAPRRRRSAPTASSSPTTRADVQAGLRDVRHVEAALTGDGRELSTTPTGRTRRTRSTSSTSRPAPRRVLAQVPAYESVGGGAYQMPDGSFLLGDRLLARRRRLQARPRRRPRHEPPRVRHRRRHRHDAAQPADREH